MVGGTCGAAAAALDDGRAAHLGGGLHHAFANHGEGFCPLNDVAVAIRVLQRDRGIRRAAIVDCDVHHGNGTSMIFERDAGRLHLLDPPAAELSVLQAAQRPRHRAGGRRGRRPLSRGAGRRAAARARQPAGAHRLSRRRRSVRARSAGRPEADEGGARRARSPGDRRGARRGRAARRPCWPAATPRTSRTPSTSTPRPS